MWPSAIEAHSKGTSSRRRVRESFWGAEGLKGACELTNWRESHAEEKFWKMERVCVKPLWQETAWWKRRPKCPEGWEQDGSGVRSGLPSHGADIGLYCKSTRKLHKDFKEKDASILGYRSFFSAGDFVNYLEHNR